MTFERANVLWNIVGVLTHLGAAEKRSTEDSIRAAAKYFQTASGVLAMLKSVLEAHPSAAANSDLSLDSLSFVANLISAQSQECYYDLALKGGKIPPDAISKLVFQAGAFYQKAHSLAEGALKDSYIPRKWTSYCKLKYYILTALAYYHLSIERLNAAEYGEQLSRLQSSHRILDMCKKEKLDKYIPELTDFLNTTSAKVATTYAAANKDNNTIYYSHVPSESKLPALTGHTMVKSVEPEAAKLVLADDSFAKIVPFEVQKADSLYCERRGDLIRSVAKRVDEEDGHSRTLLAELGLPASLDSLDSSSSVNTLQAKITTIQNEGGVAMLKERQALLDQIAEKDKALLLEALAALDAEELEDKNARSQYSAEASAVGGWARTPSHALNANLRQEAHKFMANFEQARKSDDFIKSKFAAVASHITKLASLNRESLLKELPMDTEGAEKNALATELRGRIAQLQHLTPARTALLTQLRQMAANDNIMNKLLSQPNRDADAALFDKELTKYDTLVAQINATFDTQVQLLQSITTQNAEFLASRRVTPAMEQRQVILQMYENAFQQYCDLKSHLREGTEFYTKFQDLLQKFLIKCTDHAFARKTELQDLIEDLNQRKSNAASAALAASMSASLNASPAPSAPAASPHTSNVQISQPATVAVPMHYPMQQQQQQSPLAHPSSIFASPGAGYGSYSPQPSGQQAAPTMYYQAFPIQGQQQQQQQQQPQQTPKGFHLPPGFSYHPPGTGY